MENLFELVFLALSADPHNELSERVVEGLPEFCRDYLFVDMTHEDLLFLEVAKAEVLHPLRHEHAVREEVQFVELGVLVEYVVLVLAAPADLVQ